MKMIEIHLTLIFLYKIMHENKMDNQFGILSNKYINSWDYIFLENDRRCRIAGLRMAVITPVFQAST